MSFTSCLNNAACPEATHILLHKTPVSQAFLRNKNIECVKIAPKVESLKGRMFESTNIQTIEFQSPSSSKLTEVKSYAFRDCSELNNVVLPDSLKKLEDHAFMNTKNLTTIFIPGGVEMEAKVFSGASPLKNIVTPQGIGMITAHTVPDGGYNIVNGEFVAGKPNGQPTCGTQPAGVAPTTTAKPTTTARPTTAATKECNNSRECGNATHIRITEDVKPNAFARNTRIESVVIEEGVTNIGKNAFFGCANLKSIEIPPNVTIHGTAFTGVPIQGPIMSITGNGRGVTIRDRRVISVKPAPTTTASESLCKDSKNNCHKCKDDTECNVCKNKKYLHEGVCVDSCPSGFTGRGTGNFNRRCLKNRPTTTAKPTTAATKECNNSRECGDANHIRITKNVIEDAFRNNSNIQSVVIEEGVTVIGKYAFAGCRNLLSIEIPPGVNIHRGAFAGVPIERQIMRNTRGGRGVTIRDGKVIS